MAIAFDDDPLGAVLEFSSLFRDGQYTSGPGRGAWETANLKRPGAAGFHSFSSSMQVWIGPAVSKGHLLNLLEVGRNKDAVRKKLDRVFMKLEVEHLIEPFAKDDNLATTYRVITPLGDELLQDNSYIEYVAGLPKVVERWRSSVAKIYHATDSGIGTGYLVRPNLVATAKHVVDGLSEFVVAFEDGTVVAHKSIVRPQKMGDLDLALIELEEPVVGRRPFRLSIGRDLLDEVVVFGFPPVPQADDAYLVVHRGEISADIKLYHSQLQVLVVSSLLRGGNSGGPVVNRRGHVVGTVSQNLFKQLADGEESLNEGLGFAAAIPSEWLQDLMDGKV